MYIQQISALQILDSRGMPTIACKLVLSDGSVFTASVPSGASKGRHEALELRDGNPLQFMGQGVTKAIAIITNSIAPLLRGKKPESIAIDQFLRDGKFPANSSLAVSLVIARAQAWVFGMPLYQSLNRAMPGVTPRLPRCMFNLVNGGVHVDNGPLFQEFMIIPKAETMSELLNYAARVYYALKKRLAESHQQTTTGDEGGFTLCLPHKSIGDDERIIELIIAAVGDAGFKVGSDIDLALDCAATQFYDQDLNRYKIYNDLWSSKDMINYYEGLIKKYPLVSLEDPLAEDDWQGWSAATQLLSKKVQLVGDDLFVTHVDRLEKGIACGAANAVLIKPNQVGTVTQALEAINVARQAQYRVVVSHRSGETEDDFIADLAYAAGADFFKAGACAHGERVAKYNRLLAIEASW